MKKIISFLLIFVFGLAVCAPAFAAISKDADIDSVMVDNKVVELSNKYLAVLSSMYMEEATRVGISGYHSTLETRDQQSQIAKRNTMRSLKDALDKINVEALSTSTKADYYVLNELVSEKLFRINTESELTKDPAFYLLAINSIYDLLLKDFIPREERVSYAVKRLGELPAIFKEAQRNIDNPPDLRVRYAMDKANAAYNDFGNLNTIFNKLIADEYTRNQVKDDIAAAKDAVKVYYDFLKDMMLKKDYVDFRLGAENYNALYKDVYLQDIPLSKLPKILDKELETAREQLISALTPVIEPALTEEERAQRTNKKGIIEITPADYYKAKATFNKYVPMKSVLNTYAEEFSAASKFLDEKSAFPVSPVKVTVGRSPKYLENKLQPVTYLRPYPLLNKTMGDILVAIPTSKEIKEGKGWLFTAGDIKFSAAENMTPGRNLMYSFTSEDGKILKKLSNDKFYINGWIKYSLNTAAEAGYLNTAEDKLNLAWYNYKAALFAIIDYQMQMLEINYTQALDFLISNGVKKEEAEPAADYIALNPLDGVATIIGAQEFNKVRAKFQKKLGKKFDLKDFNQRVLSIGRVPPVLLEEGLIKTYEKKATENVFNMTYF